MLDLAFIRSHPDAVKEAARVKRSTIDVDYLLEVDRQVTAQTRSCATGSSRKAGSSQNKSKPSSQS